MRLFFKLIAGAAMGLLSLSSFAQSSYDMADQTVTDLSGYLYDAGGPTGNYYPDDTITFVINVGAGTTLKLQWLEFDVETSEIGLPGACLYDYVEVFGGDSLTNTPLDRYCGNSLPPNFETSTGKITIRFTADGGGEQRGFKAYWTTGSYLPAGTNTYCFASGPACATATNAHIMSVDVDGKTFDNSTCNDDTIYSLAYSDYTDSVFTMSATTPSTVTIINDGGIGYEQVDIYIDWDSDGNFSPAGDYTLAPVSNLNEAIATIVPPTGMVQGLKRMRIRVWDQLLGLDVPPPTACGSTAYGEVEDYSILYLDPQNPIPTCATGFSPANNSSGVCQSAKLIWRSVTDATAYKVSVYNNSTGAVIISDFSTTDTTYSFASPLTVGTNYKYLIVPSNANGDAIGCDTVFFTTAANPDPTADILPTGSPLQVCMGTNQNLDGNPTGGTSPYTHTWTGSGAAKLSSTTVKTPVFNSGVTGSFKMYYQVKDANNCSAIDSADITVISEANAGTLSSVSPSNVCQGVPVTIQVVGSSGAITAQDSVSGGSWNDITTTSLNDTTYSISLSTVGTVFVRVNAAGTNCSATGSTFLTYTVTAAPAAPVVSFAGNDTVCEGTNVILVASPYTSDLVWNDANATQNDTLVVTASGTYSVSYTGASCPSTSVGTDITVYPYPVAAIEHTGSLTACADAAPLLYTNPLATETVLWNTGATTKGITASASGNYSALITNVAGCSKVTAVLAVVINPIPPKPVITLIGSANPCEGEPVTLESSYVGGNVWSTGATTDDITVTSTGNYFVRFTNSNGCSAKSDTTKLVFRPAPLRPTISVTGKVNTCNGDSVRLSVNTTPTSTWNDAGATVNNNLVVYGSGSFFAKYTNADGCLVLSDTVTTVFTQLQPEINISIIGNNFCEGNTVILTVNTPNGNTWNDAAATKNDSLVVGTTGTYFVRNVANGVCVAYSDTVDIEFDAKPAQPGITFANDTLFSTVLGTNYQWIDQEGPISNTNFPYHKPTHTGTYHVTVFSAKGCASDPSVGYYIGFTGISDIEQANIEVSPNPFTDFININAVESNNASYILTNQLGQVVMTGELKLGDNSLDIELSSGIYQLIVNDNGKIANVRLVKN